MRGRGLLFFLWWCYIVHDSQCMNEERRTSSRRRRNQLHSRRWRTDDPRNQWRVDVLLHSLGLRSGEGVQSGLGGNSARLELYGAVIGYIHMANGSGQQLISAADSHAGLLSPFCSSPSVSSSGQVEDDEGNLGQTGTPWLRAQNEAHTESGGSTNLRLSTSLVWLD